MLVGVQAQLFQYLLGAGRQTFRAQGVLHGGQRGGHGVVKIVDEGEIAVRRGDQIQRIGILQKSRRALGMGRREAQFCQL